MDNLSLDVFKLNDKSNEVWLLIVNITSNIMNVFLLGKLQNT